MTTIFKKNKSNFKKIQKITTILSILTLAFLICSTNSIGPIKAAPASIFEDGFESNNFNSWDQTYENSGGSIRTVSDNKYSGNYGAQFTTNNYGGYEQVHVTKKINANSELYARAYINVNMNGINDSEDKLYFIRFRANNNNVLFAGWRRSGSNIKWQLLIRDGSGYTSKYSESTPNTNQWYCMEVYWLKNTNNGKATLWINGNQVINIENKNTNNYGDVTEVNFGVAEAYQIDTSRIYGDNFAISDQYIGAVQQSAPTQPVNPPTSSSSNNLMDTFETRTLNRWTGTQTTSQETVTTATYNPYEGNYHSRFYSNGGSGTENAYLHYTVNQNTAYAKGYFNIIRGLPLDNQDDKFYLISFTANGQSVAGIGITRDNGEMKWTAYGRDRTSWIWPTYTQNPTIRNSQYYEIELYWQRSSTQGKVQIYIDGQKIFEINNINTDYYGNVDSIRMGLIQANSVQHSMIIYGDNFEISTETTSTTPASSSPQPSSPAPSSTTPSTTPSTTSGVYNGLSGYPTSTSNIDQIIKVMDDNNLNIYRMSFSPDWKGNTRHSYHSNYVQYFLDHCSYSIIIDRNHLYPPSASSDQDARNNWQTVRTSIFQVLQAWPNNQRVMVDLINEYTSSDFYSRMQDLVNEIRSAGYTNPIVINKFSQQWKVINDPIDNTYQGYHFYFNSWSVSGAISQMETALSKGIKILSTEVGADFNGYRNFDSSEVKELNDFLEWCTNRGIGNAVWVNENLMNWQSYKELGINFP